MSRIDATFATLKSQNRKAHHLQNVNQANPKRERLVAGFLNDWAIGAGIRKRHAQLNHIGPGSHHSVHELGCDVREREACGDVRDERFAALGFQGCKA